MAAAGMPPPPPQARPQAPPPGPGAMQQAGEQGAAAGAAAGDSAQILMGKLADLKQVTEDIFKIASTVNPPMVALLKPIIEAGKALESEAQQMAKRSSGAGPESAATGQVNPSEGAPPMAGAM